MEENVLQSNPISDGIELDQPTPLLARPMSSALVQDPTNMSTLAPFSKSPILALATPEGESQQCTQTQRMLFFNQATDELLASVSGRLESEIGAQAHFLWLDWVERKDAGLLNWLLLVAVGHNMARR
jgi:hypothetical protein